MDLAGSDRRIHFLGDTRGDLLHELFSHARVFVQPSEMEGLSIGLIEAMSYRLQCVASDIPENREAVGDTGLQFRNKDVDDLERVLRRATADGPAIVAEMGAVARRRVENLFTWDLVVDQLQELYGRVIAGHGTKKAPYRAPSEVRPSLVMASQERLERQSSVVGRR
jgi:glycosyltransferase involved in cell wall biosynthesis